MFFYKVATQERKRAQCTPQWQRKGKFVSHSLWLPNLYDINLSNVHVSSGQEEYLLNYLVNHSPFCSYWTPAQFNIPVTAPPRAVYRSNSDCRLCRQVVCHLDYMRLSARPPGIGGPNAHSRPRIRDEDVVCPCSSKLASPALQFCPKKTFLSL